MEFLCNGEAHCPSGRATLTRAHRQVHQMLVPGSVWGGSGDLEDVCIRHHRLLVVDVIEVLGQLGMADLRRNGQIHRATLTVIPDGKAAPYRAMALYGQDVTKHIEPVFFHACSTGGHCILAPYSPFLALNRNNTLARKALPSR